MTKVKERDKNLPTEEIERRKIRRERNKIAAAKCRQRRLDRINYLTQKTENLQSIGSKLEVDIKSLLELEEKYEKMLSSHHSHCCLNGGYESAHSQNLVNNLTSDNEVLTETAKYSSGYQLTNINLSPTNNFDSFLTNPKISRPQTLDIKDVGQPILFNQPLQTKTINSVNIKKEAFTKMSSFSSFDTPILKTPIFHFPDLNIASDKDLGYNDDIGSTNDINTPVVFSFENYVPNTLHTGLTPTSSVIQQVDLIRDVIDDKSTIFVSL